MADLTTLVVLVGLVLLLGGGVLYGMARSRRNKARQLSLGLAFDRAHRIGKNGSMGDF